MKLVFHFGFLAVGSPPEFLLISGVLGKIKGSRYLVFRECRVFYFIFFFFHDLEKFKTSLLPYMQEQFAGQEDVNASKYL